MVHNLCGLLLDGILLLAVGYVKWFHQVKHLSASLVDSYSMDDGA